MLDKDKKELSDKELEKATGGTGDSQLAAPRGTKPFGPKVPIDDPENNSLGDPPRARPGERISPP